MQSSNKFFVIWKADWTWHLPLLFTNSGHCISLFKFPKSEKPILIKTSDTEGIARDCSGWKSFLFIGALPAFSTLQCRDRLFSRPLPSLHLAHCTLLHRETPWRMTLQTSFQLVEGKSHIVNYKTNTQKQRLSCSDAINNMLSRNKP